jgi:ribosomal protein S18 acetylase RimI-like enzyme
MSARLRRLREDEYPLWRERSSERYAGDMVRNGGFSAEDARAKARRDFELALPAGLGTQGQHVFAIESAGGEVVGHVWLGERESPAEGRGAFVYEIEGEVAYRGQGFGRAGMLLLEDEARALELDRIDLNVFGGNEVARGLYRSLGYAERAVMMGKRLA